jgi:hypothetical protein
MPQRGATGSLIAPKSVIPAVAAGLQQSHEKPARFSRGLFSFFFRFLGQIKFM